MKSDVGLRLPQVVAVRVLGPGGPFESGNVLSLAFLEPTLGRLCDHNAHARAHAPATFEDAPIPDTIAVTLLAAAPPYGSGERLFLSFLHPGAPVRIHRVEQAERGAEVTIGMLTTETTLPASPQAERDEAAASTGIALRLDWTDARVARVVSLAEKLFAVDRLGWYRHALAMRLLLPDEIVVAEPSRADLLNRQLRALKIAATEALGTPMLSALMPNFSVDAEWLHAIEPPHLARAAAALREGLRPHVTECARPILDRRNPRLSLAALTRAEFDLVATSSVDAFLPLLLPADNDGGEVGQRLCEYRARLLELFGQTAQTPLGVRLSRLVLPNPALDDGLAALVAAIRGAFAHLSVA